MIGSTFSDFRFDFRVRGKDLLSEEERLEVVRNAYGDNAEKILELFRKAYPNKNIADAAAVDHFFRAPTIKFLDMRAENGAKTYSYMYAPNINFDGGKTAAHGTDIPYAFHNAELAPTLGMPGVSDLLNAQTAAAWANFARTGDPNNVYIFDWPEYKKGSEATLVFDSKTEARINFDRELVALVAASAPNFRPEEYTPDTHEKRSK